jgi:hypothetical protein
MESTITIFYGCILAIYGFLQYLLNTYSIYSMRKSDTIVYVVSNNAILIFLDRFSVSNFNMFIMPPSNRNARLQKGQMIVKSQGPVMAILWSDRRLVTVLTSTGAAR